MVVMKEFTIGLIIALSVSADALACGYSAGASKIKIPLCSSLAAALMSAAFVAVGAAAGNLCLGIVPIKAIKYISFFLLATFSAIKLLGGDNNLKKADCNRDKVLSVPEAVALGTSISLDGLAVGIGSTMSVSSVITAVAFTLVFTAAALYCGAKCGRGSGIKSANIVAGIALAVLAAQKLL